MIDLLDKMIYYEAGELNDEDSLLLFSELVKDGSAFRLQGHYGRTARALINGGYLDENGKILKHIDGTI